MNWPQSSYSQSNSSSTFNSSNQTGPGTPYTHQSLGGAGGYTGLQQQGYGTPGGSNSNIFSSGGYQSSSNVPSSLHQQTFSTSSPQHQQQQHQQAGGGAWQQQQQQQQGGMQGIGGYQSFGSGNQQQYGQSTGGFGNSMSQHAQQGQMMQNGSSYGGTTPYQQQFGTPGGNQYGSPQTGNSSMQAGNNAPSSGIGRYLPGYLTATSLSGVSLACDL